MVLTDLHAMEAVETVDRQGEPLHGAQRSWGLTSRGHASSNRGAKKMGQDTTDVGRRPCQAATGYLSTKGAPMLAMIRQGSVVNPG